MGYHGRTGTPAWAMSLSGELAHASSAGVLWNGSWPVELWWLQRLQLMALIRRGSRSGYPGLIVALNWVLSLFPAVTHHVSFRWSGTNIEANGKQNRGHSFCCFLFISLLKQMTAISECSSGRDEWKRISVHRRDYQCTSQLTSIVLLPAAGLLEGWGTCRMKSCCNYSCNSTIIHCT